MRQKLPIVIAAALVASLVLAAAASAPTDDQEAVHLLNRIGFGPRPGDVEAVERVGVDRFIDLQLHPDRIDDTAMQAKLTGLRSVTMTSRQLADEFERPMLQQRRERREQATSRPDAPGPKRPADDRQVQANLPLVELSQQKILRAIYSERQLQEVLTDFWFNHFNVDARKGPERFLLTEYERDVIRPRVLGRFRDLLGATAKSPAMLFYLDNWMSADPNGPHLGADTGALNRRSSRFVAPPAAMPRKSAPKGLNENYGRELLELHTLGVDGGYTQKDVTEVARAFTGWTISNPRQGGEFRFDPRLHDDGAKVVLGRRIRPGGGMHDGEEVLDLLAAHPATGRFIATKLARRFVSDTPPAALVDRLSATFSHTGGDLRAMMLELLRSPEFRAPDAYRAKVRTPLDFIVAAVRATGVDVDDARLLVRAVQQLGMPLYQCQPPTGYKDSAEAWVNTGALVNRINFALTLSKLPHGVASSAAVGAPDVIRHVLANDVSEATRSTIAKAATPQQALALTLGSPEFQRR